MIYKYVSYTGMAAGLVLLLLTILLALWRGG